MLDMGLFLDTWIILTHFTGIWVFRAGCLLRQRQLPAVVNVQVVY